MHTPNWRKHSAWAALAAFLLVAPTVHAQQQQVNLNSPLNNVGHSFYENIGTSWGLRGPGWFFNFGGAPPPAFGGFDPNGGANFGAGFRAGNASGFFNLNVGQGANSTLVSQTPSITIPNGGNGFFIDGTFRPFVTSITPVVGLPDNSDPSPLRERLRRLKSGEVQTPSPGEDEANNQLAANAGGGGAGGGGGSSAERGALSVAALKAQAAAAQQSEDTELAALLEKAKGAEAAGKPSVARIYYQMAARRATGDQQREILARLEALSR
jgi:hypothetical protein